MFYCERHTVRPFASLIALALMLILLPHPGGAAPAAPVAGTLKVLGTPSLGGQGAVIWVGVPEITPQSAALVFTLTAPDGKVTKTTRALTMTKGRAADASFNFATPLAGTYQVAAHLTMTSLGAKYTKGHELIIRIPAAPAAGSKPGRVTVRKGREQGPPAIQAVKLGAAAGAAGSAQDNAKDLHVGGPLLQGNIGPKNQEDWYRLQVDKTRTLNIFTLATGALMESVMTLYQDDLSEIEYDDDTEYLGDYGVTGMNNLYEDLNPGTYYIKITGYPEKDSGSYSIGVMDGVRDRSPKTLQIDADASWGFLNHDYYDEDGVVIQDDDWYRFEVKKKGAYAIETLPGTIDGTSMTLYGPDSSQAAWTADLDSGYGSMSLISRDLEAGTYAIKVRHHDEDDWGSYGIRVTQDKGRQARLWAPDANLADSLDFVNDYRWYQVTIDRTGEYVFSTTVDSSMDLTYTWYRRNSNNELEYVYSDEDYIDADSGENRKTKYHRIPQGTYFIKIAGEDRSSYNAVYYQREDYVYDEYFNYLNDTVGKYELDYEWVADLDVTPLSINTPLLDQNISANQTVWHQFTVTREGDYWIYGTLSPSNARGAMLFYLTMDMFSNDAREHANGESPLWIFVHLEPGTYYVQLNAGDSPAAMTYSISVYNIKLWGLSGDEREQKITEPDEADWYEFDVDEAGDHSIEAWVETLKGLTLEVYGPDQITTFLARANVINGGSIAKIARNFSPGRYFARVTGHDPGDTGSYRIRQRSSILEIGIGSWDTDPKTPGLLAGGGDVDTFQFTVEKAGTYTIETTAGTLSDSIVRLYGPDNAGRFLAGDDNSGDGKMSKIIRQLEPGSYTVRVQGRTASEAGTYQIQVWQTYSQELSIYADFNYGLVRYPKDADYFEFKVTDEDSYTIETWPAPAEDGQPSLTDDYIRLFGPDSDAKLLAQDDNSGQGDMAKIVKRLVPGTYYLKVQGYSNRDVGVFKIRVAATNTPLILNNGPHDAAIDEPNKENRFTFDVATTASITIDTRPGSLYDNFMRLYGPVDPAAPDNPGPLLAADDNAGEGNMARIVKTLAPGRYFVWILPRRNTLGGDYTIEVQETLFPLAVNGNPVWGYINSGPDTNWYAFTVPATNASTPVVIETWAGGLKRDYVRLYGPDNMTELTHDAMRGAADMGRIVRTLAPGRYAIAVKGLTDATVGDYRIAVRTPVIPLEVNGAPLWSVIGDGHTVDTFSFTIMEAGVYTVLSHSAGLPGSFMRLYGPGDTTTMIAWNHMWGDNPMASVALSLAPGTYTVRYQGYTATDLGGYRIQVLSGYHRDDGY